MAGATAEWAGLQAAIDGRVVLPGSSDYDVVRRPEMARFGDVLPQAVVRCAGPADVSAAIAVARRHRLPTAVRSGGHSVAGSSSTTGVVIDVTPLGDATVDGGVVRVGGGVRLGDLYDVLDAHGRTIPAGSSHSVGIAGLTLGGGIGILGRKHGLTCDQLLSAEVVLADGRVIECDEHHDDALFWALRGAGGGNFGVVTSLVLRTVPAPTVTIFHLVWPFERAGELIRAWQDWAPTGPDELDATLRLSATGDVQRPPLVDVFGAVLGSDADAEELLGELVDRVGAYPSSAAHRGLPYREAKRYLDGLGPADEWGEEPPPIPPPSPDHLFTKSELFRRALPNETIAALVEQLPQGLVRGQSREVSFLPWGGAYNRLPADATAFVHRDERFLIQHLVALDPATDGAGRGSALEWLTRSWGCVHPWGSGGVYPNFPDPDIEDWGLAYYGRNYDRLRRIKAKYDPDGFFQSHQGITAA